MPVATKKQLIDRWKQEPWATVDRRLVAFSTEHGARQWTPPPPPQALFGLLDGLPFREEVSTGRDLRGSSFPGACNMDLSDTDFSFGHKLGVLRNCRLDRAILNDTRHGLYELVGHLVETSVQRAKLRKTWMNNSRFDRCTFAASDLRGANLTGSDLRGSNFRDVDCSGADFQDCDLRGCDFQGANLEGAMFRAVNLDRTTDLRGARLANLVHDEHRDHTGRLVKRATDWRQALHDDTTVTGETPGGLLAQVLAQIATEARRRNEPWAASVAEAAERSRERVAKDPKYPWPEALLETVAPVDRAAAQRFLQQASLDA